MIDYKKAINNTGGWMMVLETTKVNLIADKLA